MSEITRYEIIARKDGDPHIWLIGYTPRRSRPGLIAAMRNVGEEMIDKLQIGENDVLSFCRGNGSTDPRCKITNGWEIRFSGNTKVDCRGCSHPFIAS